MAETQREKLNARWQALKTERSSWDAHWQDISDYLLPRSGRFFTQDRNNGRRRHNNIYDSTGTKALRVLGAGLMGGATSPARPWFRLATPDKDLMKYAPVKVWLNQVTHGMLNVFQRSNTYRSLHNNYEELGGFGTSATVLMDDFDSVIHHYPLTIGQYALATDYKGRVNTLAREFDVTVGGLVGEFGYSNCSQTVRDLYDSGAYDKWITVLHVIEPRVARDVTKKDARNMPYSSCYFEKGGNEGTYLRESGMKEFRVLAPRWGVTGEDIYGSTCPGMEALGDIKQLQHEQLRKAEVIDYQTKPPVQVPTSMKNRELDRLPAGISYIDMAGPTGGVKTMFEVNLNLQHLLGDIQDVRGRIRETFYSDLFLMLAKNSNPNMTATEVAERHEEKLLMLGPVLERLHNELLDPLVSMTFTRMLESGLVPPPPEELQGMDLNVEFVSMLAQAQRAVSTNSVDRFVGNLGQIATFKPNVLDKFDEDKWADAYADMLGVDPELIVAEDKVALIRDQRAKAQAAAQASALANQGADTASKLAGAPTDNKNALTDVTQMFSGYTTP
jgi:hypothetical protein